MDAFFEWLRSEQEITKQRILAGTNADSDQKKKKKKRKRKRRSLSGRRKKPSSGIGGFSFPASACSKIPIEMTDLFDATNREMWGRL